ncbi:hypothetical protein AY601_1876 [Pedobacter cryoconitis]|uniref:Dual-action HEIGH metallo-peptidase n=1 Tax=Pedobacter cryoconitis TaxID=188932 RepID=A0A127VBW3_9SPHI|nr:M57 family metalloprotease [Pedobacter cryoconitis]AMP98785.1 hypothetical protein AY601_1876 [Pedobacter cryoconitis]
MKKEFCKKTIKLLFTLVCLSIVATSCKKDEATTNPKAEDNIKQLTAYLTGKGFRVENIAYKDGRFILEKDIVMTREDVETRMKNESTPQTEHWRGPYLVKDPYHKNIKYYMDAGVPFEWNSAVLGAVMNWNNMEDHFYMTLNMSLLASSAGGDVRVFMGYEDANWIARAYLPGSNGRAGQSIEINSKFNNLPASEKLFAITHEIGHTIGFNHTDENKGSFIRGFIPYFDTPVVDPGSIMNSTVLPWSNFTAGDVLATKNLYPKIF